VQKRWPPSLSVFSPQSNAALVVVLQISDIETAVVPQGSASTGHRHIINWLIYHETNGTSLFQKIYKDCYGRMLDVNRQNALMIKRQHQKTDDNALPKVCVSKQVVLRMWTCATGKVSLSMTSNFKHLQSIERLSTTFINDFCFTF